MRLTLETGVVGTNEAGGAPRPFSIDHWAGMKAVNSHQGRVERKSEIEEAGIVFGLEIFGEAGIESIGTLAKIPAEWMG